MSTTNNNAEQMMSGNQAQTEIEAIFSMPGNHWIIAEPGTGKSTCARRLQAELILKDEPTLYIANNKTDLAEYYEGLRELVGKEHQILKLQSGKTLSDEGEIIDENKPAATKAYKHIVTHRTYICRKGHGKTFYALLNWIAKKAPTVFVDEVNEHVSGLEEYIALETVAIPRKIKGDSKQESLYTPYFECPGFGQNDAFRCKKCVRGYKNLTFTINPTGYHARAAIESAYESEIKPVDAVSLFDLEETVSVPECNFDISFIRQNPMAKPYFPTEYQENEVFTVQDLLGLKDDSFCPAIIEFYPTHKKTKTRIMNPANLAGGDEINLKCPSKACGKWLVVCDVSGLKAIARNAKQVFLLSTKESGLPKEVIMNAFDGKLQIHTPKRQAPKQAKLTVFGFGRHINARRFEMEYLEHGQKCLLFEVNAKETAKFFANLSNTARIMHSCGAGEYTTKRKRTLEAMQGILANSFGSLGKAIRILAPETVFVNARLREQQFKRFRGQTREGILESIEAARWELCMQNAGRILGDTREKTIVFHGLESKEAFERLVSTMNLPGLADRVEARWIEKDESLLYSILIGKAGIDEKEKVKEMSKENLSHRQRAMQIGRASCRERV